MSVSAIYTGSPKYPVVNVFIFHFFVAILAFLRGDVKYHWGSKLRIKQVRGVLPTIVLKSLDGQTQKVLNIEKWDTDTVTEFLDNTLIT